MEFDYDTIDYFYYHSTDIDVTRLYSILKYGIMSSKSIKENNIPYYHRNFISASCKESHISVSHFPASLWRYYKIENIEFNLNMTDFNGVLKKIFDTILFFKEVHNYEQNIDELYILIGKLMKNKTYKISSKEISKEISLYMQNYLKNAYKNILNKENINLLDIIKLYSDVPIYVMTKYDIKEEDNINDLISTAKEGFEKDYPNKEYIVISNEERKRTKAEKKKCLEEIKLSLQMCDGDLKIYNNEIQGPMTKEGIKILKQIRKINN